MKNNKPKVATPSSADKKTVKMNCGGKKRGCYITMLPQFNFRKAA